LSPVMVVCFSEFFVQPWHRQWIYIQPNTHGHSYVDFLRFLFKQMSSFWYPALYFQSFNLGRWLDLICIGPAYSLPQAGWWSLAIMGLSSIPYLLKYHSKRCLLSNVWKHTSYSLSNFMHWFIKQEN
jgi:hypothetical protein